MTIISTVYKCALLVATGLATLVDSYSLIGRARVTWLFMLCVVGAALASPTSLSGQTRKRFVVDVPPLAKAALEKGSVADIRRLFAANKIHRLGYSLTMAMLRFDMRKLLLVAAQCERKFTATNSDKSGLATAFLCNKMARIAALSMGDARTFLLQARLGQAELLKRLARAYHQGLKFGNGLDEVDIAKAALATPAMGHKWVTVSKSLPVTAANAASDGRYALTVPIQIDGRHVLAHLVPSRRYRAPVTIIVHRGATQGAYHKYGLRKLVDPLVVGWAGSGPGRTKITYGLALAKRVKFGPLVVRNLGVTVLQSDKLAPGVYLGASALRWFGGVAIGDGHIVLSKAAGKSCSPPVPMTFASTQYGNGRLLFPVSVDGRELKAIWQPGFKLAVAMRSADLARAAGGRANGFSASPPKRRRHTVALRVGDAVIKPKAVVTARTWQGPYRVIFGAAILRTHRIELQFGGKTPLIAICAAKNGSE